MLKVRQAKATLADSYRTAHSAISLRSADIKISMDGRGRYLDNIFIERLLQSLKQEAVYPHELQDMAKPNT